MSEQPEQFDQEPVEAWPVAETPAGEAEGAGVEPGVSPEAPPPAPEPEAEAAPVAKKAPAKKAARKAVDPNEPYWIALRVFKVPGREVRPGDKVPEAKTWIRPESYARLGYIKLVDPANPDG